MSMIAREAFEAWHQATYPGMNVTRKGEAYTKQQVCNWWEVWRAAAEQIDKALQPSSNYLAASLQHG